MSAGNIMNKRQQIFELVEDLLAAKQRQELAKRSKRNWSEEVLDGWRQNVVIKVLDPGLTLRRRLR